MTWRFTLSHDVLGSQVITEPGGWQNHKKKWIKHPEFFSLVESLEVQLTFYGRNDQEALDGGVLFINQVETTYGYDAEIRMQIELADDDVTFVDYFLGILPINEIQRSPDNTCTLPILADNPFVTFLNRYDTPVSLSSTEDLDGNAVDPVEPIEVSMTPQTIRKKFEGHLLNTRVFTQDELPTSDYLQLDVDEYTFDEFEDKHTLSIITNTAIPQGLITVEEEGEYTFDLRVEMAVFYWVIEGDPCALELEVVGSATYVDIYIQINDETPIQFTETSSPLIFEQVSTIYTYAGTRTLRKGDEIRIYGDVVGNISDLGEYAQLWIYSANNEATIYKPTLVVNPDPPFDCNSSETPDIEVEAHAGSPSGEEIPTYFNILGKTTRQTFNAQGYLIHDLIHGVLARIGLGTDPFYSEFLGSTFTQTKQYDADGCGWMYAILKGLQLRKYTLTEKPFFISMRDIWEGINPILNLGLGYEVVDSVSVIRIEEKGHFIGDTPPVNFSNVRQISCNYDQEYIARTIKTGYREWQTEQASGLDDPQTKHTRATRIKIKGKDFDIESSFIAASLGIEITCRTTREKSADYKYDNKNFIISLNEDDLSPDVYLPELDENFASITGLNDPETRYNSVLTPLRNFLRWANFFGGAFQIYPTSSYKFVSGEGNYDMTSDANLGSCSRAVIGDSLAESADIPLGPPTNYNTAFGYFFLPILYDITIPMEKEEFDAIDRKQPIGISQTDSDHAEFHIKELEYEIIKGEATIKAWPKVFFPISVVDQEITNPVCE